MFNQVTLIGFLGADPEIRRLQNGDSVANLRLATSESWRDKSTGEKKEKTEWHNVVIWGGLVQVVEQYAKKGSKLMVQGQLQTRKFQNRDGKDQYTTEVVLNFGGVLKLLGDPQGSRNDGGERSDATSDRQISRGDDTHREPARRQSPPQNDIDDDIPF